MKRLLPLLAVLACASGVFAAALDEFAGGPAATLRWRSGATDAGRRAGQAGKNERR